MAYPYGNFSPFNAPAPFMGQGYPQPMQMAAQPQTGGNAGYMCRPVTSRAEVEATQIPFDGSTVYFVDTSNGKIYAKTFDFNTGSAPIVTYTREVEKKVQYATIDDLKALRDEILGNGGASNEQ
jgi:hypothetical protein